MTDDYDSTEVAKLWERASHLISSNQFEAAIGTLNELLAAGVDEALVELGRVSELTECEGEDQINKALAYYRKAVFVIDDPLAHLAIARLLLDGDFSAYDPKNAVKHLKHIESQRLPGGLYGLGLVYEHGVGVESSIEKAVRYFEQAMLEGHVAAIPRLGRLLIAGGSYVKGFWFLGRGLFKVLSVTRRDMCDSRLGIF